MYIYEHVVVCTVFLLGKGIHIFVTVHRVLSSFVGQAESLFCPPLATTPPAHHFLLPNYSHLDTGYLSIDCPAAIESSACMDLLDFAAPAQLDDGDPPGRFALTSLHDITSYLQRKQAQKQAPWQHMHGHLSIRAHCYHALLSGIHCD